MHPLTKEKEEKDSIFFFKLDFQCQSGVKSFSLDPNPLIYLSKVVFSKFSLSPKLNIAKFPKHLHLFSF